MKKLLSILSVTALSVTPITSVLSCSERAIESIDGITNKIELTDNKTIKFDITKWNNDVVSATKYKNEVIKNINGAISGPGSAINYTKLVENTSSGVPIISSLISQYQKDSNSGDKSNDYLKPENISNKLNYSLYDYSQGTSKLSATFDGSKWTESKEATDMIKAVKNEKTNVYVVHFKIGVTPAINTTKAEIKTNPFIGAKIKLVDDKTKENDKYQVKINDYVNNYYINLGINKDLKNVKTNSIDNLAIKLENSKLTTGEFDYRFDILFHFSIS